MLQEEYEAKMSENRKCYPPQKCLTDVVILVECVHEKNFEMKRLLDNMADNHAE